MKKFVYLFIASLCLASVAFAAESQIWGEMRIANIFGYGQEQSLKLVPLFTMLQHEYFVKIFLAHFSLGTRGIFDTLYDYRAQSVSA